MNIVKYKIMDFLVEKFSQCSIKYAKSADLNNCQYCKKNMPHFLSAPYCDFIGIFMCDSNECKSRAMADIYEYCICNFHYPLTPNFISKFPPNIKIRCSNGSVTENWSIMPHSFSS